MADDNQKLEFAFKALTIDDPFAASVELPKDVEEALEWQASRSPEAVMQERESSTTEVERAGRIMWETGRCTAWLQDSDEHVKKVSQTVNGVMMHDFAGALAHSDADIANMFQQGAPLFGELPLSGIGAACEVSSAIGDVGLLRSQCRSSNQHLIDRIRDDPHEEAIHEMACADATRGWMSHPMPASQCDLECTRAVPRFGVVQGVKKDGSVKVRAVDNFSWTAPCLSGERLTRKQSKATSLNGCTHIPEVIKHDHLDDLVAVLRQGRASFGELPSMFKADVASAFRRIPIRPDHTWAAGIMYKYRGQVMFCKHFSAPFGASSSVYNWERVGRFFCTLARRLLHIALLEYVDDHFAAERSATVEHAMLCFARIVRAMLGPLAIAPEKLAFGQSLTVLGVSVCLAPDRFVLRPDREKLEKCLVVMKAALESDGSLSSGCAQKLAGRLQWACQYLFHRLGRAMIRPIYRQIANRNSRVNSDLQVALEWWCDVICEDIAEERFWELPEAPVAHLFVDASGNSSRFVPCILVLLSAVRPVCM